MNELKKEVEKILYEYQKEKVLFYVKKGSDDSYWIHTEGTNSNLSISMEKEKIYIKIFETEKKVWAPSIFFETREECKNKLHDWLDNKTFFAY